MTQMNVYTSIYALERVTARARDRETHGSFVFIKFQDAQFIKLSYLTLFCTIKK